MNLDAYRAVVFDLFHTLTSADVVQLPGKGTSEILGVSREEWNQQLHMHSEGRLRGKITDPFMIIEKMAHAINPSIPVATIRTAANNRIERFRYALMNIEESTLNMLGKLQKAAKLLGLISNADVNEIAGWEDSPLKQYFNSVVFSCNVGYVKPEKEIYEIALKELGVSPEKTIYVGDGGSDELMGAKKVGMKTVLTTHVIKQLWPERIEGARRYADFAIEGITEILSLP